MNFESWAFSGEGICERTGDFRERAGNLRGGDIRKVKFRGRGIFVTASSKYKITKINISLAGNNFGRLPRNIKLRKLKN